MKKTISFRIKRRINEVYLRPWIRKISGLDELEENVYYFFNNCVDITKCKPAQGTLRSIQLGDALLLKIFSEICEKNNLDYWLDWGTLLGAARHKGFIPWDDDLDVCMPRDDYNKVLEILKKELITYPQLTIGGPREIGDSLYIMWWNAGLNLDIFPMDSVSVSEDVADIEIGTTINDFYCMNGNDYQKCNERQQELVSLLKQKGYCGNEIKYFFPIGVNDKRLVMPYERIYPLKKLWFEGYEFNVPNEWHEYLQALYGNYMEFPHSGLFHHKGLNNNPERKGTDMEKVYEELRGILSKILAN